MSQLYLCEEPYWSKYDHSDLYDHPIEINVISDGITRLPVLEGEVSHVEIPRTSSSLGVTIVGGADTPLRCVVVQEVFPEGLISQDGRLRPGDQIIEINGVDMTCANHLQVCAALRKMTSVLRLGVYRERIEKYGGRRSAEPRQPLEDEHVQPPQHQPPVGPRQQNGDNGVTQPNEDMLTVTVERQAGRHLGIRLTGNLSEPGIYIADIQEGSAMAMEGQLRKFDHILFINGQDVRNADLSQASALIQNNDKLSLVVGRRHIHVKRKQSCVNGDEVDEVDGGGNSPIKTNFPAISHSRSRSEPAIQQSDLEITASEIDSEDSSSDDDDEAVETNGHAHQNLHGGQVTIPMHRQQPQPQVASTDVVKKATMKTISSHHSHVYDVPEGDDYLAIYETLDRCKENNATNSGGGHNGKPIHKNKSHSMEDLETPTPSLKSFDLETGKEFETKNRHHHQRSMMSSSRQQQQKDSKSSPGNSSLTTGNGGRTQLMMQPQGGGGKDTPDLGNSQSMSSFLKRALRLEGPQLTQRAITIKKNVRESLGMRIGGGIGSNEGDTPIYVANIHPHGCIGKSKQLKKGDLLLSVDGTNLCGLTHSQAVATLKATINLDQVALGIMDGPETSFGASNFVPSWMYWQKLPRSLQYPKTVILHRKEHASWGFSIVGGADTGSGRPTEPIHVLFVVPGSPAAKDAKLKCGDRLLAVDGQSLENIPHHLAVTMLKRTSTRVVTEVVSWMGTEL